MQTLRRSVQSVRSFNRFYTRQIGVLREGHLDSPFSLTEVRILYELAHRRSPVAAEIAGDLDLDPGYLSRILLRFQKHGFITRTRSEQDGRQSHLSLTPKGLAVFRPIEKAAVKEIARLLKPLPPAERTRLVNAMGAIENRLGQRDGGAKDYRLRAHRPGDIGWVIHRHGALYAEEYGWDERFEALVAEIAAKFIQHFDPTHDCCWMAERRGEILGSIFLTRDLSVAADERVAKLRLLLVEPSARGMGIGSRLVEECVRFARQARYKRITLWTQSNLYAAQHIYKKAGFQMVREEDHAAFGIPMTGQTWELGLADANAPDEPRRRL